MPRFKNNGGAHVFTVPNGKDEKGKELFKDITVKNGEVFETDDAGLMKKFPNKFERIPDGETPVVNATKPAEVAAKVDAPSTDEETGKDKGDGTGPAKDAEDVTDQFPAAKKNELTVKHDKAGYWLMDEGDTVNEKALRTKKALEKEITDYTK